jgi:hypothetical protein
MRALVTAPFEARVLHSFVRKREVSLYEPQLPVEDTDITDMVDLNMDEQDTLPARLTAAVLRGHLANYFVKPESSLPRQWKYCVQISPMMQ